MDGSFRHRMYERNANGVTPLQLWTELKPKIKLNNPRLSSDVHKLLLDALKASGAIAAPSAAATAATTTTAATTATTATTATAAATRKPALKADSSPPAKLSSTRASMLAISRRQKPSLSAAATAATAAAAAAAAAPAKAAPTVAPTPAKSPATAPAARKKASVGGKPQPEPGSEEDDAGEGEDEDEEMDESEMATFLNGMDDDMENDKREDEEEDMPPPPPPKKIKEKRDGAVTRKFASLGCCQPLDHSLRLLTSSLCLCHVNSHDRPSHPPAGSERLRRAQRMS